MTHPIGDNCYFVIDKLVEALKHIDSITIEEARDCGSEDDINTLRGNIINTIGSVAIGDYLAGIEYKAKQAREKSHKGNTK